MVLTIDFELSSAEINDYVRVMLNQKVYPGDSLHLLVDSTGISRYCTNCKNELNELFFFFSSWSNRVYCRQCILDSGWYSRTPSSVH